MLAGMSLPSSRVNSGLGSQVSTCDGPPPMNRKITLRALPHPAGFSGNVSSGSAPRRPSLRSRSARASMPKPIPARWSISRRLSTGGPKLPQEFLRWCIGVSLLLLNLLPEDGDLGSGLWSAVNVGLPTNVSFEINELVQIQQRMTEGKQRLILVDCEELPCRGLLRGIRQPSQGKPEGAIDLAFPVATGPLLHPASEGGSPLQYERIVDQVEGLQRDRRDMTPGTALRGRGRPVEQSLHGRWLFALLKKIQ